MPIFKSILIAAVIVLGACNAKTETSETTVESLISSGKVDKNSNAAALIKFPPAFLAAGDSESSNEKQLGLTESGRSTAMNLNGTDKKIQFSCPDTDTTSTSGAQISGRLIEIRDGNESVIEESYFTFQCENVLVQITNLSPDYRYKVQFLSVSADRLSLFHGISADFAAIPQQISALRVVMREGSGERTQATLDDTVTVQIEFDSTPNSDNPTLKVSGVYIKSGRWVESFTSLAPFKKVDGVALGWKLPGGSAQLANASTVSRNMVDTFAVEFDQPINQPSAAALKLTKGTLGGNHVLHFTTQPQLIYGDRVAIWRLDSSINVNHRLNHGQYTLRLDASQITSKEDNAMLDGEWHTGVSEFFRGSGDGVPGGDFKFVFNALIGDVDGNGRKSVADIVALRKSFETPFGQPTTAATYRLDVTGSGRVGGSSLTALRNDLSSFFGIDKSELPPIIASGSYCYTNSGVEDKDKWENIFLKHRRRSVIPQKS